MAKAIDNFLKCSKNFITKAALKVSAEFFNLRKSVCKLYDTFKRFEKPADETPSDDFKARAAEFNKQFNRKDGEAV